MTPVLLIWPFRRCNHPTCTASGRAIGSTSAVQASKSVLRTAIPAGSSTARAQSWHSEFGIQSGYTRIKPAGSGAPDQIDAIGIPGFSLPGLLPAGASLQLDPLQGDPFGAPPPAQVPVPAPTPKKAEPEPKK